MSMTVSVTACSTTFSVVAADADEPTSDATVPPPATSTPATMSASFFRMAPPFHPGTASVWSCGVVRRNSVQRSAAEGGEELVQRRPDPVGRLHDTLEGRHRLIAVAGDQGHGLVFRADRPRIPETLQHGHRDRKSTRLNSSPLAYLVCRLLLEKKKNNLRPQSSIKQQIKTSKQNNATTTL